MHSYKNWNDLSHRKLTGRARA